MLEIKNLHAGYGELGIIKGVDINLKRGKIVALVGPNGAGKSTVIKSIFALTKITDGGIILEGESILKLKTHQLIDKGIVYVSQGRMVFGDMTVEENLKLNLNIDKTSLQNKLDEVFEIFPVLKDKINLRAFTLSGGERQMLALARALLFEPKVILLDEPSLGLAPKIQSEIFDKIRELRDLKKISIIIVEQNAKKAIELADFTYVLENGRIGFSGGKNIIKNEKIKSVYLGGVY